MASNLDLNYLLPTKATMSFFGAKTFSFNVQTYKIPKMFGYIAEQPTPHLAVPLPGNKLVYDLLEISFLITENLESYLELYNWMRGIYAPYGSPEYKNKELYLEQAELAIYNASNNLIMKIKFIDIFPVKLDEVLFDTESTNIEPVKTKVEFAYRNFDISQ